MKQNILNAIFYPMLCMGICYQKYYPIKIIG